MLMKLELEEEIQFQFDEDGNKIWNYGPDESESEMSVETTRRITKLAREAEAMRVNDIEIPPLNLSFLDDENGSLEMTEKRSEKPEIEVNRNRLTDELTLAKDIRNYQAGSALLKQKNLLLIRMEPPAE